MSNVGIRSAASRQFPYHLPEFPSRQSVKDRPTVAACRHCPRRGPDFGELIGLAENGAAPAVAWRFGADGWICPECFDAREEASREPPSPSTMSDRL
jgi:rubredoxin